jgi:hypothetical protein
MARRQVPATLRQPMSGARSGQLLWRACLEGREPAESLDPRDREDLVVGLVGLGWTDLEIATLTRMSLYTTARIRHRLVLAPNRVSAARYDAPRIA